MTENKRFTIGICRNFVNDNTTNYCYSLALTSDAKHLCDLLNKLSEKNEQLKTQLQNVSTQRDEFYRGAKENANCVGKLEKENEQLKQQIKDMQIRFKRKYDHEFDEIVDEL